MLTKLRFLSAGESHGPRLVSILDGMPAGIPLDVDALQEQLARRQKGYGSTARMKIETDRVRICGGMMHGATTGGPIAFELRNRDWENWRDREVEPMTIPRPGHADLTGAIKYGHRELRLSLERASARETAMRVAAGSIARQLLDHLGVEVGGYVRTLGEVDAELPETNPSADVYRERFVTALSNDLTCPADASYTPMREAVKACRKAKDTLGGVVEVVALGLPPGLGSFSQWDTRLEARIAFAMLGVQAMKGVEIGPAFQNSTKRGTNVQDEIFRDDDGRLFRETNRAGGLEGGITTGEPLVVRIAKKPISTTLEPRRSVDLATGEPAKTAYERSDFCAVSRAVPILEAMLCLVLADAMIEKLGGDSLEEMRPRLESLRRSHLDDLPMNDVPWRFAYGHLDDEAGAHSPDPPDRPDPPAPMDTPGSGRAGDASDDESGESAL